MHRKEMDGQRSVKRCYGIELNRAERICYVEQRKGEEVRRDAMEMRGEVTQRRCYE